MNNPIGIGIIGLGGIANGKHIPELEKAEGCKITAICDIDAEKLNSAGERLNIDKAHRFADYKSLIACDDVDAVEICTPNYLHVPMALEAVAAGKPVNVEKPLSTDLLHAQPLEAALIKNPVLNMMCFSYRFFPAVRFAKWILEKGLIGKVINADAAYLKSSGLWENRAMEWRFIKEYAGTGVLGDLGVHLIDMTRLLLGDFRSVNADTRIIVKQRPAVPGSNELVESQTDDYCQFTADIGDDICGNFVITRCAIGNVNTIKYDIYATDGVISFNLNNPDELAVCIGEVDKKSNGLHTVKVPPEFKASQEQMFINMLNGRNCEYLPTVKDGLECQKVLDALLLSSERKCRIDI